MWCLRFLLGHGGEKVTLIILEKKVPFALGLFLERNIIWNSTKKEGVSEGQYSKKMLSTIALLIFNTLMDGLMHAWPINI